MPPATRIRAFLLVFTAFFLGSLIVALMVEFSDAKWIKMVVSIGDRLGRLTFVNIAATFILVEGVPMLASWIRREEVKAAFEKGHSEGHAEGRSEGRVQGSALEREAWLDWLRELEAWEQSRAEAEKEGKPFNQPRPHPPESAQTGA